MATFYPAYHDTIDELSADHTATLEPATQTENYSSPFPEEPLSSSELSEDSQTISTATQRYPHSHQEGMRGFQNPYFNSRVLGGGVRKRGKQPSSVQPSTSLSSSHDCKYDRRVIFRLIKKLRRDVKGLKESARSMRSAGVWKTASEVKMMRGLVKKVKRRGVELTEELADREFEKIQLQRMVFRLRQEKRELEERLNGSRESGKAFMRRG